jgi:hypothetical protein
LSLLSTPVGAGALAGVVTGCTPVGCGATDDVAPGDGAGEADPAKPGDEADPAKPGDEAACPDVLGAAGADVVAAGAEAAPDEDDDAEEPDAGEEATPAGVVALPDPYPVGVLRGANWLPTSSMTPSTPPVSSVIVDVSSFTSACTLDDRAEVQLRR